MSHSSGWNDERRKIARIVGANIRDARQKAGLNQTQLADKIGMINTNVSYMETGKRMPKLETIVHVSKALNIPIPTLLEGIDS